MEQKEILKILAQLRKTLLVLVEHEEWIGYESGLTKEEFNDFQRLLNKESQLNHWFTKENCLKSLRGITHLLESEKLTRFANSYSYTTKPKTVAIVMAGNIPFVGFHDLLCVLITGNSALCKLSSSDSRIPMQLISWLLQWNPELTDRLKVAVGPIKNYDAVIATGSNASLTHFETYFGHVPHIFRKNRTSVAVLDGTESNEELKMLGADCFDFFGMGCRNVSKLFLPEGFDLNRIFENFLDQAHLINHHKYGNNYDYNRTVYLMNQIPFLDNNAFMLKEDPGLHAPLSVIYYSFYSNQSELKTILDSLKDEVQAVVGHDYIPFGEAQSPHITDFPDGIDVCKWLNSLS